MNIFYKIISFSSIDYPSALSAVLFVKDCNLRCPYCYNFKRLQDIPFPILTDNLFDILNKRKKILDAVVLSGGEILLDQYIDDLKIIIPILKDMGYKIKIDTNGCYPNNLERLLSENLIDFVAMDIKSRSFFMCPTDGKQNQENQSNQLQCFKLLLKYNTPYELRTTAVHPFIDNESITDIAKLLFEANDNSKIKDWHIQNAYLDYDEILDPNYLNMRPFTFEETMAIKNSLKPYSLNTQIR